MLLCSRDSGVRMKEADLFHVDRNKTTVMAKPMGSLCKSPKWVADGFFGLFRAIISLNFPCELEAFMVLNKESLLNMRHVG